MKIRPFIVLLLFVASTSILVWIYYSATKPREQPAEETWVEIIADLDACCRRKHVKSLQYDHFASIADLESRRQAARLFRAMALSERLQEYNCAEAIHRLGGRDLPPRKVLLFRRTAEECTCGEIDRAIGRGNRYAARLLSWSSSVDMRHAVFMHACLGPQEQEAAWNYLVCPRCGNLFVSAYCEPYCPFCLTSGERFIRFE